MKKFAAPLLFLGFLVGSSVSGAAETRSFVPPHCAVESWCLVKATDCTFTHFSHPAGLDRGHAQYSVVRRAVALCREGYYGEVVRREFLGPVEPVLFASETETTEEAARSSVMGLCSVYRADWVSAAPRCDAQCN